MLYEHEIQIRVRYCETDAMGRLHHMHYIGYLEQGRTEQLRSLGQTYRDFEASGLLLVVTKLQIKYRRPASYDDLLHLRTMTVRATHVRIDHEYELYCEDELLATASSTLACVDREGEIQKLPDWLLILPPPAN